MFRLMRSTLVFDFCDYIMNKKLKIFKYLG